MQRIFLFAHRFFAMMHNAIALFQGETVFS